MSTTPRPVAAPLPLRETPDIESSSADYAGRFAGEVGRWFLAVQREGLRQALAAEQPGRVLDVGGGHCQNLDLLLELGWEPEILGSVASCAALAEPWLAAGRVRFTEGDLLHLPYADGSFDAVISFRNLPHLRDWQGHLRELGRVSRSLVVVDYPALESVNVLSARLFFLKRAIESDTRRYRLFRRTEIDGELAAAGFGPERRYPQFLLPMALYRGVGSAGLGRGLEGAARRLGLTGRLGSPVIASYRAV